MEDESLNRKGCFAWLKEWTACPTYTVASMLELYEQLLPTKVYASKKAKTSTSDDVQCRLCRKCAETVPHILVGCSALAQNKYMERHNAALKVLYFELLQDLELIDEVPIWYSPVRPKPIYENSYAQAFWDVPLFAEHNEVRANRVDARVINHKLRSVVTLEMSCPWIENRSKKDEEKALKYGPMRWELKQQYPGYSVEQYNIIVDVLGGWSKEMEDSLKKLLGSKCADVLKRMQKCVISSTLNIARTFKVVT